VGKGGRKKPTEREDPPPQADQVQWGRNLKGAGSESKY